MKLINNASYIAILLIVSLTALRSTDDDVYICDSKTVKKYHLVNDCRGLNACKAEIKKVTLTKAKETGTLCGWED